MLAVAFALALSLRLALPAGLMPVQTAQGLVVSLCGGMAGATIVVDVGLGEDPDQPGQERPAQPCAFALLGAPAVAGDAPVAPAPPASVPLALAVPPLHRIDVPRRAFLVPPLRGPPALA